MKGKFIMKKYFIMLVMMFAINVFAFANESATIKMAENEKYELKINHRRLACVLDMSNDQAEISENVISELEKDMVFASSMDTEERRDTIVINAIKKNIKYMHYVLNDAQYKKYLMLLNLTLKNRGFDIAKINK